MSKQMVSNQSFYTSPMLGILLQTKELSIIHFKDHNFEFKSKKKSLEDLGIFLNFKHKINATNMKFSTMFCISNTVKKK